MDKCKNCKYFYKLYVPPLDVYKDIPKDGYVCVALMIMEKGGRPMWLGTEKQNPREQMCEMFEMQKE